MTLTCAAEGCSRPSEWQPVVHVFPVGSALDVEISPESCVCDIHKRLTSWENFISERSQQKISSTFDENGYAKPDWARSRMEWKPLV